MHESKIDIKAGRVFPWQVRLVAAVILLIGLLSIIERPIVAIVLLTGSLFVISGLEGTEIDKAEKFYREYMSFFLLKKGKKIKYSGIEKIFINTSKISQKYYTAHTNHSSVFTNLEYNAYMKFSDGIKIHLMSKRKKKDVTQALDKIATFLNVHIEDNTA
jgi:hypothetical protein